MTLQLNLVAVLVTAYYDQIIGRNISYEWHGQEYYTGGEWNHDETDAWASGKMEIVSSTFPYGNGYNPNHTSAGDDTVEVCDTTLIPNVVGMPIHDASNVLGELGYGYTWKDVRDQVDQIGLVVRQEPKAEGCYDPRRTIVIMYRNMP